MKKQVHAIAFVIAVIFTVLFVGSAFVSAHGSEESFEIESDGYLVDIGYSVKEFTDDTSVVFDFGLDNADTGAVEFSDVWVRVVRTDRKATVFAGGINNARLGGAIMTYVFPEAGEYELSARYQKDGDKIVEATFPLTVIEGTKDKGGFDAASILLLIAGLLAGLGAGFFLSRIQKVI